MSFLDKQAVFAILQTTHDFFLSYPLFPCSPVISLLFSPHTRSTLELALFYVFSFTSNSSRIFADSPRLFPPTSLVHLPFNVPYIFFSFFILFRFFFPTTSVFFLYLFSASVSLSHCFSIFSKACIFFMY